MKKFELKANTIEVKYSIRDEIKEGITTTEDDRDDKVIASFDNLEDAKAELSKYDSSIRELSGGAGKYYEVREYYIEENIYDDDGEWIDGGDIWDFSKFKIELVEKPSYNVIATFDNMKAAEAAYNNYNGDEEVYLSF